MLVYLYLRFALFNLPMWIAEPNQFIFYTELIITIIAIIGLFPIAKEVVING